MREFIDGNGGMKNGININDNPESDNGYFRILNPDWRIFQ
jgi:hypothetical protein